MLAKFSSETLVPTRVTRRHNPEDGILHEEVTSETRVLTTNQSALSTPIEKKGLPEVLILVAGHTRDESRLLVITSSLLLEAYSTVTKA
jgi:hypothetical protein